jgi:alpha-glucosidase (family GH31 glycosyl hydrolase)
MLGGVVRALLVLLMAGCGPGPAEGSFGGVRVRVEPDPFRIVVSDGKSTILESLPGAGVKPHDPPLVAAAFRTTHVDWAMLYGSFNPDESYSDWQGVPSLSSVELKSDGIAFAFAGGSGRITVHDGLVDLNVKNPSQNRASMAFRCATGEHFVGFGAQTADVDQRGQTVPLWVSEQGIDKVDTDEPAGDWFYRGTRHQTYFPVPFFLSSRNYGVELETTRRSLFALCSERADTWRVEAWEGEIDLRLFRGDSPADVLRARSDANGRAPAPPPWTWAPWNDAIFGSAQVRQIAAELRANHIPSSVIWTEDWAGGTFTGDNYGLNYDWAVDRTLYPDVEQVASDLHAAGFKWLAYFNTFVESDSDHYQEGVDKGYLIQKDGMPYLFDSARFKPASLVDLSNPAAADWMAQSMTAALGLGFDGWMADYGEWLPVDAQLFSKEDAEAVHNTYPVAWQKLNERVLGDDQLSFVRSGYLGSQKIAHQVVWGGDQLTEFKATDGLPTVPILGMTLGLSGMPYFGSDIGGYTSPPNHPYSTKELFFRWTTVGALSPIMRTHHGTAPLLEWRFDKDAETLAHYGRWARLHQKLFPYLRAAADEAAAMGMPMMRSLLLAFPADDAAWSIKDEWLLGPSLLVAPVVTEGATAREVHLPPGRWLPVFPWGGEPVEGTVQVDVPLTEIPVYVQPGTQLDLLGDEVESLTSTIPAPSEKWVFLDGEPTSLTWNAAPLVPCGSAPCVTNGTRSATVQVPGSGTLAAGSVTLTLAPEIRIVVLRW